MAAYVLIVEDEPSIQALLDYNLRAKGFDCSIAVDIDQARLFMAERRPDLMILDWMLPGGSGVELLRQIRRHEDFKAIPVIMLTARADEADKIRGLGAGADDYIVKPFSPGELIARIDALLRRTRPALAGGLMVHGPIEIDTASHRVKRHGHDIHLSATEFRLLVYLVEQPTRVFSREHLLDAVWGMDQDVELRTVDATIRRLRRQLNNDEWPDALRTVRSEGYGMNDPSSLMLED